MRTIILTLGDPGGIGPELVRRTLSPDSPDTIRTPTEVRRFLVLGPEAWLRKHLDGLQPFWTTLDSVREVSEQGPGVYLFQPEGLDGLDGPLGRPSLEGGLAAGTTLETAVELMNDGVGQALLTCPLNKATLQQAGFDFPGHTEFLAERSGAGRDNICMHLAGPRLRVSLVTTHPPLARVAELVTRERILTCLKLTADHLRRLGLDGPVAVCGLNPHAGESGRMGREEIDIIAPAVEEARGLGLDAVGPLPADSLFHFAAKGDYGAVLAMYHDQGLAPLKLLHFSEAVNTTLGLPWPRTSPDHGTAYDLVGTGQASITSFTAALEMLKRLVANS